MKTWNRMGMLALAGCLLATFASAAQTDYAIGKTGAAELKLGLGPRPVAMGEAFIAKADDLNATAWNAAGLAQIKSYELGFMHNIYLQETSVEYLAYAQNLFEGAGIGANLTYVNYGKFEKMEVSPTGLPLPAGEFTPQVFTFSAGYGQWFLPELAAGGTLKYYSQTIDSESYSVFAVDIGGLYKPGLKGLQVGAVVQNLGTPVGDYALPMTAKVGAAYEIPAKLFEKDVWNVLLDIDIPFGDTRYIAANIGTEFWYTSYALRLGYKIKESGGLGGATGLTLGLGIRGDTLVIDYAMVAYGELGMTHQFAVGVHF